MSDFSIMLCLRACAVLFVVVASDDDMLISVSEDGERFVRMPIHAQPLGFCVDHLPNTDPEICTRVIAEGVAARLDPNRDVVYPPSYASQNRWHYRSRIASPAPHDEASEFAASAPPSTHPPCKLLDELPRSGRGARGALGDRLRRRAGDDGALSLAGGDGDARAPDGGITILLRLHSREHSAAELISAREPGLACVEALRRALAATPARVRRATTVHALFNGFASRATLARWVAYTERALGRANATDDDAARLVIHAESSNPSGNAASFAFTLETLRALALPAEAIVLLLEDDVLLLDTALAEMVELFETHDPCFVTPIDHADYYALGGTLAGEDEADAAPFPAETRLLVGRRRHWATSAQMMVTYAARQGTLDHFARGGAAAGAWPIPSDDLARVATMASARGASIVRPLPSLAVVVENLSDLTEPSFALYVSHAWARGVWRAAAAAYGSTARDATDERGDGRVGDAPRVERRDRPAAGCAWSADSFRPASHVLINQVWPWGGSFDGELAGDAWQLVTEANVPADHERWWRDEMPRSFDRAHALFEADDLDELARLLCVDAPSGECAGMMRNALGTWRAKHRERLGGGESEARPPRPRLCLDGRELELVVIGDSHARLFDWVRARIANRVRTTLVASATARGLRNASSSTRAAERFASALDATMREGGSDAVHRVLVVMLGEVDAGSMLWLKRAAEDTASLRRFANDSARALDDWLRAQLDGPDSARAAISRVVLIGATPPTIARHERLDEVRGLAYAEAKGLLRPHANARSLATRRAAIAAVNAALAALCDGELSSLVPCAFVDVSGELVDDARADAAVRRPFANLLGPDWHVSAERTYGLVLDGVRRALGARWCGCDGEESASWRFEPAAALPVQVDGEMHFIETRPAAREFDADAEARAFLSQLRVDADATPWALARIAASLRAVRGEHTAEDLQTLQLPY